MRRLLLLGLLIVACFLNGQTPATEPAASAENTAFRIRVSERVLDEITEKRILPEFPPSADKSLLNKRVIIAVVVNYDGTVYAAKNIEGDPVLADVAIDAIKQWRFKRYTVDGKAVQVESRIILKFRKKGTEQVFER